MKVNFSISTFNRAEIVKVMASSLNKLTLPDNFTMKIFDDNSTEYNDKFLKDMFPIATLHRNSVNMRASQNMRNIHKEFMKSSDDYLLQLDSDVIINENFYQVVQDILNGAKDLNAVYSLYNSTNHSVINGSKCVIGNNIFHEKETIGGICVLFPREILKRILENVGEGEGYDWRWSFFLRKHNIKIFVSETSYVQHIGGFVGQNNKGNFKIDFGRNFQASNHHDMEYIINYQDKIIQTFYNFRNNLSLKQKVKLILPPYLLKLFRRYRLRAF